MFINMTFVVHDISIDLYVFIIIIIIIIIIRMISFHTCFCLYFLSHLHISICIRRFAFLCISLVEEMTTTTTTMTTTTPPAKINSDRLFLSRLSETYQCRLNENVFLECYVRFQRIKSIVWFANGERVEKRGVRLWYRYEPTTGQCILCIRSVLYCDEGSYCCQATSIDNVVETLEVKLKIDNRSLFSFLFYFH